MAVGLSCLEFWKNRTSITVYIGERDESWICEDVSIWACPSL